MRSPSPPPAPGGAPRVRAAYCAGHPQFHDTDLAQLAQSQGPASAWAAAFSRHGVEAPARVSGDFAVAVSDSSGRVMLAVDRFSICNLYYQSTVERIVHAPRADQIGSRSDLDPQSLFEYLYFHVIPAPRSVFSNVQRVPAGHYVLWERGQLSVAAWWTPEFDEDRREPLARLREEFRELLRSAVSVRSLDGRVGCFLSGGTDSSTIAGMLGVATGDAPPTFSIGFDASGYDEMSYARIAAKHFGADHHEYYVTPNDVVEAVPHLAATFDQPFGNSSVMPAFYCARMAHDAGIGTLLAGDGGDELFGGNVRYARQRVLAAYEHIPRTLRKEILERGWLDSPLVGRLPGVRKLASYVQQARVPMPERLQSYNLLLRIGLPEIFTSRFLESIDPAGPLRQQQALYASLQARSLVNRMLGYDFKYTLADTDLPKVTMASTAAGIASAFPLLDDRLVDFSLRLAPSLKVRGLTLRWFFKDALRDFLPKEIISKRKHGFGLPFGVWMVRHAELRRLSMRSLDMLHDSQIVRPEFLRRLDNELMPSAPGYYGELMWILMMLGQWIGQAPVAQSKDRIGLPTQPGA